MTGSSPSQPVPFTREARWARGWRSPRVRAAVALVGSTLALVLLNTGVATSGGATCPSRLLFDTPCASCGMTRAFAALTHGDLAYALRANAGSPVAFLFALALVALYAAQLASGRPLARTLRAKRRLRRAVVASILAVLLFSWVMNILRHREGRGPLRLEPWHNERGIEPLFDLPGGAGR